MASVPSLSEITSIKGDAELGFGGSGTAVELKPMAGVGYLMGAAQAKAAADKFTYESFQKNLEGNMKNFNEMDVKGLLNKDYAKIGARYAAHAAEVAENIDVMRNPMSNPTKFAELKRNEAQLNADISRSKQDLAYITTVNNFASQHPSFNSVKNKAKIAAFTNGEMGERTPFSLDNPIAIDFKGISEIANKRAEQKLADVKVTNQWMTSTEETKYLKDAYDEAWKSMLESGTEFGDQTKDMVTEVWSELTPEQRKEFGSKENYWSKVGETFINQNSITKKDVKENAQWQRDDAYRKDWALQAQKFKNDKEVAALKRKLDDADDEQIGEFANTETTQLLMNGAQSNKVIHYNGKSEWEFNNIKPAYAKLFAAEETKIDPKSQVMKTSVVMPDTFSYTEDGAVRPIFYQREEKREGLKTTTALKRNSRGQFLVDTERSNKLYTGDQIRAGIATMVSPNKVGQVLMAAQRVAMRKIKTPSLDNGGVNQYADLLNIPKRGKIRTGSALETAAPDAATSAQNRTYTTPNGKQATMAQMLKYQSQDVIDALIKEGKIK